MNSSFGGPGSGTITFTGTTGPAMPPEGESHAKPPAYASFFVRLAAFVMDHLILYFAAYLTIWGAKAASWAFQGRQIDGEWRFIAVSLFFYMLLWFIYFVYFFTHGGQTPGKMALGIRVVALDGGELDAWRAVFRTVGYGFSWFLFGLGFLWAGLDRRRQSWHDKLGGTVVLEI